MEDSRQRREKGGERKREKKDKWERGNGGRRRERGGERKRGKKRTNGKEEKRMGREREEVFSI